MVTPSWRNSCDGVSVFDLLAAEGAAVFQASGDEFGQARIRRPGLRCSGGRRGDFTPRAASAAGLALVIRPAEFTSSKPGGHVARDGFAQALGLLRALAFARDAALRALFPVR